MEDLESEAKFAISHTRGSNTLTAELDFEPSTGDSGFKDNIAKGPAQSKYAGYISYQKYL